MFHLSTPSHLDLFLTQTWTVLPLPWVPPLFTFAITSVQIQSLSLIQAFKKIFSTGLPSFSLFPFIIHPSRQVPEIIILKYRPDQKSFWLRQGGDAKGLLQDKVQMFEHGIQSPTYCRSSLHTLSRMLTWSSAIASVATGSAVPLQCLFLLPVNSGHLIRPISNVTSMKAFLTINSKINCSFFSCSLFPRQVTVYGFCLLN